MSIFSRLFGGGKPTKTRGITWDQAYRTGLVDSAVRSGVNVNEDSALTLSTVWRAARVVAESVSTLPLKVYTKEGAVRTEARDNPLWTVLYDEPNPEMSTVDFLSLMQWWAVLWGNAYAEVERDGSGQVLHLWPVAPWLVKADRTPTGNLVYVVNDEVTLSAEDVVHIKGPTPDGSTAYRLVQQARESFGFSIACDQFGASFFGNAARPSGVLESAGQLSDQARENLRASWTALHSGISKAGTVAVLEEGLQWKPTTISNEAGQYDQTRQFQVLEVCRWLGVDPIFVYAFGANPGGVAEQQTRNFLTFTLNPWLRKWESELTRKCVPASERGTTYPEFVREAIISLDVKTQHEVWAIGVDKGWYEVNEVRAMLNMAPLPPKPEPVINTPAETNGNTPDQKPVQ